MSIELEYNYQLANCCAHCSNRNANDWCPFIRRYALDTYICDSFEKREYKQSGK